MNHKERKEAKELYSDNLPTPKERFGEAKRYKPENSIIAADINYKAQEDILRKAFDETGLNIRNVPVTKITIHHGCMSCEWKDTSLCPFGFSTGVGKHFKDNTHANGICNMRLFTLLSYCDEKDKMKYNYPEWLRAYNKAQGQIELTKNTRAVTKIEEQIDTLRSELDEAIKNKEDADTIKAMEKNLRHLNGARIVARDEKLKMWTEIRRSEDRQEDREHTKSLKIEHTSTQNISLIDIHDVMRNPKKEDEQIEDKSDNGDSLQESRNKTTGGLDD